MIAPNLERGVDSRPAALAASSVGHVYRRRGIAVPALTNVSLDVGEGEFVAIVGPSGGGKSTLLRIMAGIVTPTQGVVSGLPKRERAEGRLGIMFQSPVLAPWLSVRRNLLLLDELRGVGRAVRKADLVRADELLEQLDLAGFGDSYPFELSGGMQQRVALARALMSRPAVMLLDEPFGALDALTRASMNMILQQVWLQVGCSILLVTHDISEAVLLADRVVVLSSRPGHVVGSYDVALPRPRTSASRFERSFLESTRRILETLEGAGGPAPGGVL